MANGKHVRRHTSRVVAVLGVSAGILVLVLGGMAFAAYHYEQARSDTILPGVSVGGVDVGGMTARRGGRRGPAGGCRAAGRPAPGIGCREDLDRHAAGAGTARAGC